MPRLPRRFVARDIERAWLLLPRTSRRKLLLLVCVQMFLGSLDLLAVGLVGLLGTLAVAGVQSSSASGYLARLVEASGLAGIPAQRQVAILGVVIAVLFLGRTAASILLIRRALHFLAYRAAEASADLARRLLSQPLTYLQTRSTQDFLYSLTSGANALVLGVLGTLVTMVADFAMLFAVALLLLITAPTVAFLAGVMLLLLVLALHRFTTSKAQNLAEEGASLDVAGRDTMVEALSTYRELVVRGSRPWYSDRFRAVRLRASHVSAETSFLPNVSKYVLETAVILGALVIGAVEFALEDAQTATAVLAMFLAAGTRLAPAIIRLQQGVIQLRGTLGAARRTFEMIDEFEADQTATSAIDFPTRFVTAHSEFNPSIQLEDVTFTYPASDRPAVDGLSVSVSAGQMLALVGASGAGKSTTADLILGVLRPQAGKVLIAGLPPAEVVSRWPGAVGYVPQDVWIADGSVRKNVCLGYDDSAVSDDEVWAALDAAQLAEFAHALPGGLESRVGERGSRISGGQRQRLGIARAMVTRPKLLVMDEATSALDAQTEHAVTDAIRGLRGHVTLVVVAHRLATVRDADVVLYFEAGSIAALGSFDEVRRQSKAFEAQARLLGL